MSGSFHCDHNHFGNLGISCNLYLIIAIPLVLPKGGHVTMRTMHGPTFVRKPVVHENVHDFAEKGVYFNQNPTTYDLKTRGILFQKISQKQLNADGVETLENSEFYQA